MNEETKPKNKKKKTILSIVVIVLIGLLGFAVTMFVKHNSSTNQIEKFDSAVKSNNYNRVASMLSNNETNISKEEAEQFVKYVKKDHNYKKYQKELKQIKHNIKDKDQHDVQKGKITDNHKNTLVDVRQNGKKWLIFDKVTFQPHKYNVYVKEFNNKATYKYKLGKSMKTDAEPNKYTLVGKFFVGNYKIDTEKTIKDSANNGKLNGQLIINTEKRDNKDRIVADDSFNQSWFNATLKNQQNLDNKTLKLHINKHTVKYNQNKVYGKLSNQNNVNVYATGSVYGKEFKTDSVRLNQNQNSKPQQISLKFDDKEIEEHIKNYEKIEDRSKKFIKEYTKDLNKSYKKNDPIYVETYFDKESDMFEQAKKDIKNKDNKGRKYNIKDINDFNVKGEDVELTTNTDIDNHATKIKYTLELGYKNKYFKIKDVQVK